METSCLTEEEKNRILSRAIIDISTMGFFHSERDFYCKGALEYAAHYVGCSPTPDEISEMTVKLREALAVIQRDC